MFTPRDLVDHPDLDKYVKTIKVDIEAKFNAIGLVFDESTLYADILKGIEQRYNAGDTEVIDRILNGEAKTNVGTVGILHDEPVALIDSLSMARDESLHIAAANFSTMNNSLKEASNRLAENMRDLHEGLSTYPAPSFMMRADETPKMYGKSEANDRPQPISDQKRAKARKKRKKAQRAARGRK
ncbi:hypothetical protein ValSw41_21 [Vibrio phage ValSw4_1]|nr:hypothetical protein ValSw41_21 [Vibrio phage ValSw4_1]